MNKWYWYIPVAKERRTQTRTVPQHNESEDHMLKLMITRMKMCVTGGRPFLSHDFHTKTLMHANYNLSRLLQCTLTRSFKENSSVPLICTDENQECTYHSYYNHYTVSSSGSDFKGCYFSPLALEPALMMLSRAPVRYSYNTPLIVVYWLDGTSQLLGTFCLITRTVNGGK